MPVPFVAALFLSALPASAQFRGGPDKELSKSGNGVRSAFKETVAQPAKSTVILRSEGKEVALGTIVSADGYIVTKASELRGKLVVKLRDGRKYTARLVGVEDRHDIGLIKIEASGLIPVAWLASKNAEVGNWVAAPTASAEPAGVGVVSVATRKPSMQEMFVRTAPKANSGYLGITLQRSEDEAPTIGQISPESPASKAGLRPGDTVLTVAGRMVRTTERLIATIQGLRPGQTVSITVKRGDEEKEFTAKLEHFPLELLSRGERMNMLGSELSYRLGGFPVILQHDLLLKPSDCGGPLVDLDGKTVGINIARAGRTETYAIPAETVQGLIPDLKSGKLAPKEEFEDKQVALLRDMVRELRADIVKAESKLGELAEDVSDAVKKAAEENVTELKKKLTKTQEELEKARTRKP